MAVVDNCRFKVEITYLKTNWSPGTWFFRITKARMDEFADELFIGTQPWNDVLDRNRFGIPNLIKYTSDLLINLIQEWWVVLFSTRFSC